MAPHLAMVKLSRRAAPLSSIYLTSYSGNIQFIPKDKVLAVSARQQQLLDLLCSGHTNKEIASEMSISPDTVKSYLHLLYDKFHVYNRIHLATTWTKLKNQKGEPEPPTTT